MYFPKSNKNSTCGAEANCAQPHNHLQDLIRTYGFARHLPNPNGFAPYKYIGKTRTYEPERFIIDPIRQIPEPDISPTYQVGMKKVN